MICGLGIGTKESANAPLPDRKSSKTTGLFTMAQAAVTTILTTSTVEIGRILIKRNEAIRN
jgi:hypothetical protein